MEVGYGKGPVPAAGGRPVGRSVGVSSAGCAGGNRQGSGADRRPGCSEGPSLSRPFPAASARCIPRSSTTSRRSRPRSARKGRSNRAAWVRCLRSTWKRASVGEARAALPLPACSRSAARTPSGSSRTLSTRSSREGSSLVALARARLPVGRQGRSGSPPPASPALPLRALPDRLGVHQVLIGPPLAGLHRPGLAPRRSGGPTAGEWTGPWEAIKMLARGCATPLLVLRRW